MHLNNEAKQSLKLIILQVISIVVGVFSTFYVAASLSPEIYAILGIYSVISSVISIFSNTGLETFAGRNVLVWNNSGNTEKTIEIVSQAFFVRFFSAIVLILPMSIYSYYISKYKFDGQYFSLFIMMCFCGVVQALNDSMGLILKAFNNYFLAALSSSCINVFGKIIALFLFIEFGFSGYVYCILCLPIVITIPLFIMNKKWFSLKYILNKKNIINNIKQNRFFTFSAYLNFGIKQLDLLLVSVFLKPEITGTFTLVKRFQGIISGFLANVFEPSLQKLVQYKNNVEMWRLKVKKIIRFQKVSVLILLGLWVLFIFVVPYFISLFNLHQYPFLRMFLIFMLLAEVVMLSYKVRYFLISLFYSPLKTFILSAITSVFLIVSFLIMQLFSVEYLFLYSVIGHIFILIFVFCYAQSIDDIEKNMIINLDK